MQTKEEIATYLSCTVSLLFLVSPTQQLLSQRKELLQQLEQGERDFTGGNPENPCCM